MKQNKLAEVADRMRNDSSRDLLFGAFMAMVIAFMLIATASSMNLGQLGDAPALQADAPSLVEQLEQRTAQACGDFEMPEMPAHHADPAC